MSLLNSLPQLNGLSVQVSTINRFEILFNVDVFILNSPDDEQIKPYSKRSSYVAWDNLVKLTLTHPQRKPL